MIDDNIKTVVTIGHRRLSDYMLDESLGVISPFSNFGVDELSHPVLVTREIDFDVFKYAKRGEQYAIDCFDMITNLTIKWLEHNNHPTDNIILCYKKEQLGCDITFLCIAFDMGGIE